MARANRYSKAVLLAATLATGLSVAAPADAAAPPGRKFGLVVRNWFTAVYETRFADECPAGLAISNNEYWCGGLSREEKVKKPENGMLSPLEQWNPSVHRGPNNADVCLNPDIVEDPPMATVEGKISYGKNLDGTTDGRA